MKPRALNVCCDGRSYGVVSGFTLIEVMVVVIIISVIVSSILFSVDLTGNQKARTAISNVQLLMRGLSNEAILEGNHYGIKWDRPQQRFVPIVDSGNGWSTYSSNKGAHPDFKPVSWKGFAEAMITVGGISFDERVKDEDGFYSGQDEEEIKSLSKGPLVEFWPTGLWQPAGEIQFFVAKKPYATLRWTASGRMHFEHGNAP